MRKELTHEQAAILRAIDSDVFTGRYIGSPKIGSDDLSWAIEDTGVQQLTPEGTAALMAYDAKWQIVLRQEFAVLCSHKMVD